MLLFGAVLVLGVAINAVHAAPSLPTVTDPKNPPIVFKRVSSYDWVYDDGGTGADRDLAIYRPRTEQHGYYAVGDTAVSYHSNPKTSAIMVKERLDHALAAPVGFTEIWNDRGSGGRHDVRIMRMNPPSGYVCVGYVAVLGYGSTPDANKYRCVHRNYVTTTGRYEAIWLDHGSGASADVGVYGNRVSDSRSLDANAFTAFATHATPGGSAPMLNGEHVINHQSIPAVNMDQYALTVFQGHELTEIWNDRGSGANRDISTWRSSGASDTYSLGDLAVSSYGKPGESFVAKEIKDGALRQAMDWRQIWNDAGSGARSDGAFWSPICPFGYTNLGHVSMRNHWQKPGVSDFRCVKTEYTLRGKCEYVWNDAESGANRDLTIWRGIPVPSDKTPGQGVGAIYSVARHGGIDGYAYVLNSAYVNYVVGKPAAKYILTNVRYECDVCAPLSTDPTSIASTTLTNYGNTQQSVTRSISYTTAKSYSWSNTAGLEIGVTVEVSAGVPGIADVSASTTVTASFSHEWGGSETESTTDQIAATVNVPPKSRGVATITGNSYTTYVPYTANLKTVFEDGTSVTNPNFKGVFHGVQVLQITVVTEDFPLE